MDNNVRQKQNESEHACKPKQSNALALRVREQNFLQSRELFLCTESLTFGVTPDPHLPPPAKKNNNIKQKTKTKLLRQRLSNKRKETTVPCTKFGERMSLADHDML